MSEPRNSKLDHALIVAFEKSDSNELASMSLVLSTGLSPEQRKSLEEAGFEFGYDPGDHSVVTGWMPVTNLLMLEEMDFVRSASGTQKLRAT